MPGPDLVRQDKQTFQIEGMRLLLTNRWSAATLGFQKHFSLKEFFKDINFNRRLWGLTSFQKHLGSGGISVKAFKP